MTAFNENFPLPQSNPIKDGIDQRGFGTPNSPHNSFGSQYSKIVFKGNDSNYGLRLGRIVEIWAKQGVILVLSGASNIVRCQVPSGQSHYVWGVKEMWLPGLGEFVLFATRDGTSEGTIICAMPYVEDNKMPQFSPLLKYEKSLRKASQEILDSKTFDEQMYAPDEFGKNRPKTYDMTSGERYVINDNLVGYMITDFFMRFQAGELCKANFHFMDNLFEGLFHNLRIFNSGFNLESICDFGRTNTEFHISAHLRDHVEEDGDSKRRNACTVRLSGGWLDCGYSLYTQNKQEEKRPGSNIWLDELGMISEKSLISCSMMKTNGIFVPERNFQADHHDLNKTDAFIDGRQPRIPFDWSKADALIDMAFGCMIRDYIAWQTAGDYRFIRYEPYEKDWQKVPATGGDEIPKLAEHWAIMGKQEKLEPQGEERKGDFNKYRKGEAFCGILPDGSISLRDAWGSELILRGGRIIASAALDVEVVSGVNFTVVAGRDICMKAESHVEVIAIKEQMRLRSCKMIEIESKEDGIQLTTAYESGDKGSSNRVLEGKGRDYMSPGITLKSKSIHLISMENTHIVSKKSITLEGHKDDEDQPNIQIKGQNIRVWSTKGYISLWLKKEKSMKSLRVTENEVFFSGDIWAQGGITAIDGITTDKGIVVQDGGLVCAKGIVGKSIGANKDIDDSLTPYTKSKRQPEIEAVANQFTIAEWDEVLRMPYKESKDFKIIQFKHRTTDQFRTQHGRAWWFESHWQRIYDNDLKEIEFDDDKDKDDEHSYPGKEHIGGSLKQYGIYKEKNVYKDGNPKKPEDMDITGGTFERKCFSQRKYKK